MMVRYMKQADCLLRFKQSKRHPLVGYRRTKGHAVRSKAEAAARTFPTGSSAS